MSRTHQAPEYNNASSLTKNILSMSGIVPASLENPTSGSLNLVDAFNNANSAANPMTYKYYIGEVTRITNDKVGIVHPKMDELLQGIFDKTNSQHEVVRAAAIFVEAYVNAKIEPSNDFEDLEEKTQDVISQRMDKIDAVYNKLKEEYFPEKNQNQTNEQKLDDLQKQLESASGKFTRDLVNSRINKLQNPSNHSISQ